MIANEGWVKIHREILRSAVFQNERMFRLFVFCIANANHTSADWLIPGTSEKVHVPRGSFITGQDSLYRDMYPKRSRSAPSRATLWRLLHALESGEYITLRNLNNRASMVTVCNYETYQDIQINQCKTDAKPVKNRCKTDAKLVQTIEECKEGKECKEDKEAACGPDGYQVFFPPRLNLPECHQALQDWVDYKFEQHGFRYKSNKSLNAVVLAAAMKYPDQFCHDITNSIAKNWKGIYEDKNFKTCQDMPACKEDHANFDFANDRRVKPWLGLPGYDGMVTLRRPGNVNSN